MSATAKAGESAPAQGSPSRVPDFFIVGHQKCGTTALYEMLRPHPQIFLPEVKEPRFFVPELLRPDRRLSTLEGYLALFADARADQRVGEASPQYIRSPTAARAIAEMQPAAKIVAILREPASFLRSFHLQMVQSGIEPQRDFRKAIELEPARRAGRRIPRGCRSVEPLLYSRHVRYAEQLAGYRAAFAPEQMLVLIYDDFRRDNVSVAREILRFLEVDDQLPLRTVETNPNNAIRSQVLRRITDAVRGARLNPAEAGPLGRAVNSITPGWARSARVKERWRRLVYKAPAPPDEAFTLELRRRFKPEVVALSDLLDRDLVREWDYDAIG